MEIEIVQTKVCVCGRKIISVTGRCSICISEGSKALARYLAGEISFPKYMRELRKHGVNDYGE